MTQSEDTQFSRQRESVKKALISILGLAPELVSPILDRHRDEIFDVYQVLEIIRCEVHRQWAAAVLAGLPHDAWEKGFDDYTIRISPHHGASMRFLARTDKPEEKAEDLNQGRRVLLTALLDKMIGPQKLAYRSMIEWTESDDNPLVKFDSQPLAADSAFGLNLVVLEDIFTAKLATMEMRWVKQTNASLYKTIPAQIARDLASHVVQDCSNLVLQWLDDDTQQDGDIRESLLARVSANISVNRALLELAAIDEQGLKAAEMVSVFLDALNRCGIESIPDEVLGANEESIDEIIAAFFTNWFSFNGALVSRDDYFKRHMTKSDIKLIINWSNQLQGMYVNGRGRNGDLIGNPEEALNNSIRNHGGASNRFLFALAMAGAFYETSQVDREVRGGRVSEYSVFPGRAKADPDEPRKPMPHAAEFLQQAYGQIFYGNDGDYIRGALVHQYAVTASIKRAHKQMLLHFAVRNRSSRQLLSLNRNIQRYVRERLRNSIEVT